MENSAYQTADVKEVSLAFQETANSHSPMQNVDFEEKKCCGFARGHNKWVYILIVVVIALAATVGGLAAALIAANQSTTEQPTTTSTGLPTATTLPTTTTTTDSGVTMPPLVPGLPVEEMSRVDCWPETRYSGVAGTAEECYARGCAWDYDPHPAAPACYVSSDHPLGYGYKIDPSAGSLNTTDFGMRVRLLRPLPPGIPERPDDEEPFIFEVKYYGENLLNFRMFPERNASYEIPEEVLRLNKPSPGRHISRGTRYIFSFSMTPPFTFTVTRASTGRVLWDTDIGALFLSAQLNTISTKLPSPYIYGFGANKHRSFKHETDFETWGMFARDEALRDGNTNNYGVHPFYTCVEDEGFVHGVYLHNSNAMEYSLSPLPKLTFRTLGGILDFYMFMGPSAENVVQQYTSLVGRPFLPPYWALGFQQSRFGYKSLEDVVAAVDRTVGNGIPLDVQHVDIDYMDERRVFTLDTTNFGGLPDYIRTLKDGGVRSAAVLYPQFDKTLEDYVPYNLGRENNIFIQWPSAENTDGQYEAYGNLDMIGYLWPFGRVAFPDFLHPNTSSVWSELIMNFHDTLPIDGISLAMNEPTNFGTNEEQPWNWPIWPEWSLDCPVNEWDDPEYRSISAFGFDQDTMASRGSPARLSDKTLCMFASQGDGAYRHYDVHNLHGMASVPPTVSGLQEKTGERGLVISRSTFPGTGQWAGTWLGNNHATWEDLRHSIIGMLEHNLFGIPYVGSDICGFHGDTTPNLCKRWLQLGAFYPLSRVHNDIDSLVENDPGSFDSDVVQLAREALETRYTLLPFLYSLFARAHIFGNTVVRPLHHEFPLDFAARYVDTQFMWGSELLFCPILWEDSESRMTVYLPTGRWYVFNGGWVAYDGPGFEFDEGFTPMSALPMFVRGGSILPLQESANNTKYSRLTPFRLRVFPDREHSDTEVSAAGELFWDDGVGRDTYENGAYYHSRYVLTQHTLKAIIHHNGMAGMDQMFIGSIEIHGSPPTPAVVLLNGEHEHHDFDPQGHTLLINNLMWPMDKEFTLEFRTTRMASQEEAERVDCLPDGGDHTECAARGCNWAPTSGPPGVPRCYMNTANNNYYFVSEVITGNDRIYMINVQHSGNGSMMPDPVQSLNVLIQFHTADVIRLKISPADESTRYQVPVNLNVPTTPGNLNDRVYDIEYERNTARPFYIRIWRISTGSVIWDTRLGGLTFSDKFMQITTRVPSERVYGFGEHKKTSYQHKFDFITWPMFAREQPIRTNRANLYGVHPYYLCVEDDAGNSHGSLLLNSNAMEVVLQPAPSITYRTLGGVFDFYFMLGTTPEDVTAKYIDILGGSSLPPYWALGFHLSRQDYTTTHGMTDDINTMMMNGMPIDVQHIGLEHMSSDKVFTIDQANFGDLPEFTRDLRDNKGIRTIIRMDSDISIEDGYEPYATGRDGEMFVRWPDHVEHSDIDKFGNRFMHGHGWPMRQVVYPDFSSTETSAWWESLVREHHAVLHFDGVMLYGNEPVVYNTHRHGSIDPWTLECPTSQLDDPPYDPVSILGDRLSDQTLCMVGEHRRDGGDPPLNHYDFHNVFCLGSSRATYEGLQNATHERGLVLSRSTFPTSGGHAGHWFGDIHATWHEMRASLINMLDFNLFGIDFVGTDICGTMGAVTQELCIRWMQLGSFYPFSRSNTEILQQRRGPADLGPFVADAAKKALDTRYFLLPYMYTVFFRATSGATDGQGSVVHPVFHEFPADIRARDIDTQFMWGKSLMVAPVLFENTYSVMTYFPAGRWFDFYSGEELVAVGGQFRRVDAPIDYIPLFVRGGSIIVKQQPNDGSSTITNTRHSRGNHFHITCNPNESGNSTGELFWDDGYTEDTIAEGRYSLHSFYATPKKFRMNVHQLYADGATLETSLRVETIQLHGIETRPSAIFLSYYNHMIGIPTDMTEWTYNENTKVLYIRGLDTMAFVFDESNAWELIW